MGVMPTTPWWTCEPEPRLLQDSVPPKCREIFGVDDNFSAEDDRLVQWLQPRKHLDAITAFRKISGEGIILDDPALPQAVQGPLPNSPKFVF